MLRCVILRNLGLVKLWILAILHERPSSRTPEQNTNNGVVNHVPGVDEFR